MLLRKTVTTTTPLLIGVGLFLSACAADPGYDPPTYAYGYSYPYPYPVDGSLYFDYGGWGGWHHGWDHGHWDHAGWGHGFAGHTAFAGHGGLGGAGGGGHR
jgi:hypothetical protein